MPPKEDPILSLALSVHSNPGVFAVLLGSGVSSSAGIPTGWDIVLDLIRKLAHLRGEDCGPEPEAWYRDAFEEDPDYSEILKRVAKSSSERSQLLRGYFEPTEDEAAEGLKAPTASHKSIANLVAKGYIRVVLTTNFDRLLERALAGAGVQPVVISTGDASKGALPLAHSRCTVIKVNGDYLDRRLRNTRDELEAYELAIRRLLAQVFDEYGLIVSGWSGEWDTALRSAMEGCSTHRFTCYWTTRSRLHRAAENLVVLRRAIVVEIGGADEFFSELLEKVSALEQFTISDPLSAQVALKRAKSYLQDATKKINFHDLVTTEVERVHAELDSDRFPVGEPREVASATLDSRLRAYENRLDILLPIMTCGSYWCEAEHSAALLRGFQRLTAGFGSDPGLPVWLELRKYPALLLLYGMGISAIAGHRYWYLQKLLALPVRTHTHKPPEPVARAINHAAALDFNYQKMLPGREQEHTPLSNHLFELLREPLRQYLPDDSAYSETFDWFEYLICLLYCDAEYTRQSLAELKEQNPQYTLWAPIGRFSWKREDPVKGIRHETELRNGEPYPEKVGLVLEAGFFESFRPGGGRRADKYDDLKAGFDRYVDEFRRRYHISF